MISELGTPQPQLHVSPYTVEGLSDRPGPYAQRDHCLNRQLLGETPPGTGRVQTWIIPGTGMIPAGTISPLSFIKIRTVLGASKMVG